MKRLVLVSGVAVLAACSGGGNVAVPPAQSGAMPFSTQQVVAFGAADAVRHHTVHVGFTHAPSQNQQFGELAYYAPNTGNAAIVTLKHGAQVVFLNDGTGVTHTASGLGSSGFPASFDNTNGPKQAGKSIGGNTTWSTGNIAPGKTSVPFVVGPPGDYYFGCFYHYGFAPSMRDVIVSI